MNEDPNDYSECEDCDWLAVGLTAFAAAMIHSTDLHHSVRTYGKV